MQLQLDPGFTNEAFLANAGIQIMAAIVGAFGAFFVAWFFFGRA